MIAGTDFICNAVMAAYLVNELLSITENLGLMGVPVPKVLTSAIDLLRQKSEAQETNKMHRLIETGAEIKASLTLKLFTGTVLTTQQD